MRKLKCHVCGCMFENAQGFTKNTVRIELTTDSDRKCWMFHQLKYGHYCNQCLEDRKNEIISCLCDGKFVIDPN